MNLLILTGSILAIAALIIPGIYWLTNKASIDDGPIDTQEGRRDTLLAMLDDWENGVISADELHTRVQYQLNSIQLPWPRERLIDGKTVMRNHGLPLLINTTLGTLVNAHFLGIFEEDIPAIRKLLASAPEDADNAFTEHRLYWQSIDLQAREGKRDQYWGEDPEPITSGPTIGIWNAHLRKLGYITLEL